MSIDHPRRPSAAYRVPGVIALALLGGGGVLAAHRAEQRFSDSSYVYRSSAPKMLQLHSSSADVEIVPGTGRLVRIQWRAEWVGKRPSHSLTKQDGVLRLGSSCAGGLSSVTGLFTFDVPCSAHYRVEVPAGQAIRLEVSSGDVKLTNLRGRVDVATSSGDISARDMPGGGTVKLAASSGDISARFDGPPASLTATASSGDVSVHVPSGRYRIDASASSGDRSVQNLIDDPASTRTIVVQTKSGDVWVGADE
jgi:hypothetical protein